MTPPSQARQSAPDASAERIELQDPFAAQVWAKKLNISGEQLREAIEAVGNRAADVEMHLKGSRSTSFWSFLLVMSLIVFGANTGYSIYKARLLGGASTAASNLQVNSQKLANQGREAVGGNADSFAAFKATRQQINDDIGTLVSNYGQQPSVAGPISTVAKTWTPLNTSAQQVIVVSLCVR